MESLGAPLYSGDEQASRMLHVLHCTYMLEVAYYAAWSIYGAAYTYFLIDTAGFSSAAAARVSTVEFMVYLLTNFFCSPLLGAIADSFGRRPIALMTAWSCTVLMASMAVPAQWAWYLIGMLLGGLDAEFLITSTMIADAVGAGVEAGCPADWQLARVARAVLLKRDGDGGEGGGGGGATGALQRSYTILWLFKGVGVLLGLGAGLALLELTTPTVAMLSSGLVQLPIALYLRLSPESQSQYCGSLVCGGGLNKKGHCTHCTTPPLKSKQRRRIAR